MCGAAAMLGGFTHMTLAIVVLLVEAAHDLSLVPLLMLSISVSHVVSTGISHHGYDEVLIHKKGVPFIEADIPHELETGQTAIDLMDELPDQCLLPQSTSVEVVQAALDEEPPVQLFPVLEDDGSLLGLSTRARLEAAVSAHKKDQETKKEETFLTKILGCFKTDKTMDQEANVPNLIRAMVRRPSLNVTGEAIIPIYRLMDAVPHIILEDMPAPRFYSLYSCGAVQAACVISKRGEFRGILSRRNLISAEGHKQNPGSPIRNVISSSPSREQRSPVKKKDD